MNKECKRIADQFASTINGEAWHGDSLHEILKGITVKQALAHPIPQAHSIWELVHHIAAWEDVGRRRLEGQAPGCTCSGRSTLTLTRGFESPLGGGS